MNLSPKGDPKVKVEQEYTVSGVSWPSFVIELYVGALAWSVILNRPDWTRWLVGWWPGAK